MNSYGSLVKPLNLFVILCMTTLLLSSCTTRYIQGTKIEDSDDAREIIKTVELYRKAMESRNADMLVSLVSRNYFEKNGDSNSRNNYDYDGLVRFLRSSEFRQISAVRMTITYKNIIFNKDRDVATVRYHYSSEFKLPHISTNGNEDELLDMEEDGEEEIENDEGNDNYDKEVWHSKSDDNEMILELENGRWQILKGM